MPTPPPPASGAEVDTFTITNVEVPANGVVDITVDQFADKNNANDVTIVNTSTDPITYITVEKFGDNDGQEDVIRIDLSEFDEDFTLELKNTGNTVPDQLFIQGVDSFVDNEDGTYTVTYTGTDAQTHTVTVIAEDPTVTQVTPYYTSNATVDGADGAEVMDVGYTDARDDDEIDGADGLNDSIVGNGGSDTISGGAGNDTIEGDIADIIGRLAPNLPNYTFTGAPAGPAAGAEIDTFTIDDLAIDQNGLVDIDIRNFATKENANDITVVHGGTEAITHITVTDLGGNEGESDVIRFDLSTYDDDFLVTVAGQSTEDIVVFEGVHTVTDNGDGTFELTYFGTDSALHSVTVNPDTAHVEFYVTPSSPYFYDDEIDGGAGDDEIDGGYGDDSILGGIGADTIIGNIGADTIDGGDGADVIFGDWDQPLTGEIAPPPTGTAEVDTFSIGDGEINNGDVAIAVDQFATPGNENDVLITDDAATESITTISISKIGNGDGQQDVLRFDLSTFDDDFTIGVASEGTEDIFLFEDVFEASDNGDGTWTITYYGEDTALHTITVTPGLAQVEIYYAPAPESLLMPHTDDVISGGAGDDTIDGGLGNDIISGGDGNDSITGGASGTASAAESLGANLIVNGDFSDTGPLTQTGQNGQNFEVFGSINGWTSTGSNWGLEIQEGDHGTGVQDNDQVTEMDNGRVIEQTVNVTEAGTYRLSLDVAMRNSDPAANGIEVFVDGVSVGTIQPTVNSPVGYNFDVPLTTGNHVISFTSLSNGLTGSVIDNVALQQVTIPTGPGDTISGGDGDDTIITEDGNDSITGDAGSDTITAGAGDDTIDAGTEADSVDGGLGHDTILGGDGDDTIYGGDSEPSVPLERVAFNWSDIPDPDDGGQIDNLDPVVSGSQTVGGTNVSFTVTGGAGQYETTTVYTSGIDAGTGSVDTNSSLGLDGANGVLTMDFSTPVENLQFNLNDFEANSETIFIQAYDAQGNLIPFSVIEGSGINGSDTDTIAGNDTFQGPLSNTGDNSAVGSIGVTIPGPVAQLVIDYVQTNGSLTMTDVWFDDPATGIVGGGDDSLDGGLGDDLFIAGDGTDTIIGGTGADTYDANTSTDLTDETITVTVDGSGDGTSVKSVDGTTDTFTSIETFVAGEDAAENDTITITDSVSANLVTGMSDATVGIFTPDLGSSGPIAFGGSGEPTINQLLSGTYIHPTFGKIKPMGSYAITSGEEDGATVGDASFSNFENINFDVICFARGTRILTDRGEVEIEDLRAGDLVETLDHGLQPIRWIGSTVVRATGNNAPIEIKAGALGNTRDLRVSPQHRMMLEGWQLELLFGDGEALVPAKNLINDHSIRRVEGDTVEYFHMLLDTHEIVFAEGAPSESFHPGAVGMATFDGETLDEIYGLFPGMREDIDIYGPSARISLKAHEARVLCEMAGLAH